MEAIMNKTIDICRSAFIFDMGSYIRNARVTPYHQSWSFQFVFIFKLLNKNTKIFFRAAFMFLETINFQDQSSNINTFVRPFSKDTWILVLLLLLLVCKKLLKACFSFLICN